MIARELFRGICDIEGARGDTEISGVYDDSREVTPGGVFVAIKGNRLDGERFISDAIARGAKFIISERNEKKTLCDEVIFVENTRKTLAVLCARFNGNPEKRMKIVGITGTKGKTTTVYTLSEILKRSGVENVCIGTLGIQLNGILETNNTTPSPVMIFSALSEAEKRGIGVAIIEVSSQALKDYRVYGIPFLIVGFTSLGDDHVGAFEHKTRADYIAAKHTLFTSYGAKLCVANGDDAYSSFIASGTPKCIKCGFCYHNDVVITDFSEADSGSHYKMLDVEINSSLHGRYNAVNTAIALIIAAILTKTKIEDISDKVHEIYVNGRFEEYYLNGRHIIIDYAHTPESFSEISKVARSLYHGRQIAVFGSVSSRGEKRRRALASTAEQLFDFCIITGDDVSGECAHRVCSEMISQFKSRSKALMILDRYDAIKYAIEYSWEDDVIFLLGRGHENKIIQNGVEIDFSERNIVQQLLKNHG